MSAIAMRLVLSAVLTAASFGASTAQDAASAAQKSEIARIRLAEPDVQIFQVFIDRRPITVLYRKGSEVGFEFVADEDGIECRHDVAVVTSDGRLADLPGVNFCENDWVVTVDAASFAGGAADRSAPTAAAADAPSSDENCGWLAIMACRSDSADAERDSTRIMGGVSVIATNDYQGLDPDQYCAAQGPYATEAEAEQTAGFFRGKGAADAYTKQACEAREPSADAAAEAGAGQAGTDGDTSLVGGEAEPAARELELQPGWNFVPPSDTDSQAILAYAEVANGTLQFMASCSTADSIAVGLYRAPDGAAAGTELEVDLATGRFRQRYGATVSSDAASVALSTGPGDPLWRALAAHTRLDITIGSLAPYSLSLRGSGVTVRPFIDTCVQMPSAPAQPPAAGAPDAESSTGTEPAPGGAARYACERGPDLEVFFDNARGRAVVSVDGEEPIALDQAVSGSGFLYRSGEYELSGKAGEAVWGEPGNRRYSCRRQ